MKKVITTTEAPGAIGPYSQAIEANGFIFVSGQLPVDPTTGSLAKGDIKIQTEQSIKNIAAILKKVGCGLDDVVKTCVFLSDISNFGAMNDVYAKYFSGDCPARSAVQVAGIPKDAFVEIEAIAVIPGK
jgi:2-iminobutanoate/2-iminopropanoate deaminase